MTHICIMWHFFKMSLKRVWCLKFIWGKNSENTPFSYLKHEVRRHYNVSLLWGVAKGFQCFFFITVLSLVKERILNQYMEKWCQRDEKYISRVCMNFYKVAYSSSTVFKSLSPNLRSFLWGKHRYDLWLP